MTHTGRVSAMPASWQAVCTCGWALFFPTVAKANEALRQHVKDST